MNWADLSVGTIAPWTIVAAFVYAIMSGRLVPRPSADKEANLLQLQVNVMRERLDDKDKVIAGGLAREETDHRTITEQADQIKVLADLAETTNRLLNALPRPRSAADESS